MPVATGIYSDLDAVIAAEQEFSPEFCSYYLRECLSYRYGAREKEGLSAFQESL